MDEIAKKTIKDRRTWEPSSILSDVLGLTYFVKNETSVKVSEGCLWRLLKFSMCTQKLDQRKLIYNVRTFHARNV